MSTIQRVVLVVGLAIGGWGPVAVGEEVPREYVAPEELVSFTSDLPFDEALVVLNEFADKLIIDRTHRTAPIGVEIRGLPWRRALYQILQANGLEPKEYADYMDILVPEEAEKKIKEVEAKVNLDTKQVRIAAIFFEGNRNALNELGVNWTVSRENRTRVEARQGVTRTSEEEGIPSVDLTWRISPAVNVVALLQAFESKDVGEVIANPQITVISGQQGRIQVGQDVSILRRDFAGNVIPELLPTGIILTVTPETISQDEIEFVHLIIETERSSALAGAVAPTINRTSTKTSALLRDGEQVIIAGLYSNDEAMIRRGIPFLRNLPWWVFGLRYLTGYNYRSISKKELIVLIQATIVPSVRERIATERETMQEMFERERGKFQTIQEGVRKAKGP